MPLRLNAEGVRVVDEWRKERCQSPDDERLVAEVLRAVSNRDWQYRWDSHKDETDRDITIIKPRPGLRIHVQLWDGDNEEEFGVAAIDEPPDVSRQDGSPELP